MIRDATVADARRLAGFGARTFEAAFGADNSRDDMAAYLSVAFNEQRQLEELQDSGRLTLLAEVDGRLVGYAQIATGPRPPEVAGRSPMELARIYVDKPWQGRGVAARLLGDIESRAVDRGADVIWLGVWEHNPRAQAFYRKHGYVDVGHHTFTLGTDVQIDRIMTRALARRS